MPPAAQVHVASVTLYLVGVDCPGTVLLCKRVFAAWAGGGNHRTGSCQHNHAGHNCHEHLRVQDAARHAPRGGGYQVYNWKLGNALLPRVADFPLGRSGLQGERAGSATSCRNCNYCGQFFVAGKKVQPSTNKNMHTLQKKMQPFNTLFRLQVYCALHSPSAVYGCAPALPTSVIGVFLIVASLAPAAGAWLWQST